MNKIWATILKAPAIILLLASLAAGVYAAQYNIQDMGWEVPIILAIVIGLYFIGVAITPKSSKVSIKKEITDLKDAIQNDTENF